MNVSITPVQLDAILAARADHHCLTVEQFLTYLKFVSACRHLRDDDGSLSDDVLWQCWHRAKFGMPGYVKAERKYQQELHGEAILAVLSHSSPPR